MNINIKKFFFQNIGTRQIIFKNTFWLVLAEVIIKVLSLVLTIYIVRILGATEYGKFAFAFSFVSIVSIFSDLGVIDVSVRELSRNKDNEEKFPFIFTLQMALCLFMFIIAFIGSFFITFDEIVRKTIWILSIFFLTNSLFGVIFSFLRARQKMEYEALTKIVQSFANTIIVFLIIFYVPSIENIGYGYLISNIIVLLCLLILFSAYLQPIKLKWNKYSLDILKMSWPLTLGFMASWTYLSINSVMLGYFNLIIENGWYNAAFKIAAASIIPASLIIRSFYPTLSNFYVSSREKLQKSWDYLAELMILLAIPTVTGGIFLAPKIINSFYSVDFYPSILALRLLIVVIGITFISFPYSIILVVADQQKKNFYLIIIGSIINIILNFIFIPIFGFYGTIISSIISSLFFLISTVILAKKLIHIRIFDNKLLSATLISTFSSALMYFAINLINNFNIITICLIGGVVYVTVLFILYRLIYYRDKKLLF